MRARLSEEQEALSDLGLSCQDFMCQPPYKYRRSKRYQGRVEQPLPFLASSLVCYQDQYNTVAFHEGQPFEYCHRSSAGLLGPCYYFMADSRAEQVSGSLAGLMYGVMIKRLGHNAHILEQYTSSTREGQAAGISAGPQMREFLHNFDLCAGKYALVNPGVRYIDTHLNIIRFQEVPMMLTSWNILYYRLRANFDGLKSEYCAKLPEEPEGQGKAVYDTGKRVTDVNYANGQATLVFDDLINGKIGRLQPDLVIGADGSSPSIRQLMLPQLKKPYSGYFTWRGTIPERDVSDETKKIFDGKVTVSIMDRSYIVLYTLSMSNYPL